MNRLTLLVVLVVTSLVVTTGAVGAVTAPLASGGATVTAMQEGDGNATVTATPTATPVANDSTNQTDVTAETNTTNATDEPPTFGAVVSSFMQTSAADAENEVEDGLFEARFERSNASERARLVRQRATQLGDRIAELREERATLLGSENVTVRERAQAARLAAQADGLTESISHTENAAQRAGVALDQATLDELRTEARNLTGAEVADLARGLVDKEKPPRGPPSDRGPDRDGSTPVDAENVTDTNETDLVDDRSPGRSGGAGRPTETSTDSSDDGQSKRADERANGPDQRGARSDGASGSTNGPTNGPTNETATPTEDGGDGTETESAS